MANNNSSRITPANYIAIISLALLALFTFFGWMYGSEEGEIGLAAIMTVFEIGILVAILWGAIKAKSARSHRNILRIAEYGCVLAYVLVAILFAAPLLKYFYVMSEKDHLQAKALNEIEAIDTLYANYEHTMETATRQAVAQLENYVASHSYSPTIKTYIDSMAIDPHDIATWGNLVRETWQLSPDSSLVQIRRQVKAWGIFDLNIAQVGKQLENKGNETVERLNRKVISNIDARVVPVIRYDGARYVTDSFIEPTFDAPVVGDFHNALRNGKKNTVWGLSVFIILHLLILLNYLVTEGSHIVGPGNRKKYKTNGIEL